MKDSLIRAARTTAQTLAATLGALPVANAVNLADISGLWETIAVACIAAVFAGVVSFLQNVSNADPLPK